jgi:hypothetical protein
MPQAGGAEMKKRPAEADLFLNLGAQERTRTSTVLPPPGPEPGASTNSATWARCRSLRDVLCSEDRNYSVPVSAVKRFLNKVRTATPCRPPPRNGGDAGGDAGGTANLPRRPHPTARRSPRARGEPRRAGHREGTRSARSALAGCDTGVRMPRSMSLRRAPPGKL